MDMCAQFIRDASVFALGVNLYLRSKCAEDLCFWRTGLALVQYYWYVNGCLLHLVGK